MFCQWARKIGFTTWLCPWMEVNHVGTYVFNGTLKNLGKLDFASHGADMNARPHKESRKKRRAAGLNKTKKKKLTTPTKS